MERKHWNWKEEGLRRELNQWKRDVVLKQGLNPGIFFDGPFHEEEFWKAVNNEKQFAEKIGIFGSRADTLRARGLKAIPSEKKHPIRRCLRRLFHKQELNLIHTPLQSDIDVIVVTNVIGQRVEFSESRGIQVIGRPQNERFGAGGGIQVERITPAQLQKGISQPEKYPMEHEILTQRVIWIWEKDHNGKHKVREGENI